MSNRRYLGRWILCGLLLATAVFGAGRAAAAAKAKNVILMIGDGMGFEQVRATSYFMAGRSGALSMESMPVSGEMATSTAVRDAVTDSAAAGAAMATGVKVRNGVLSLRIPGDGKPLPTILEICRDNGLRTGLVTTTYLTHATPAAFAAHVPRRGMAREIAKAYLVSGVNVLMGGGGKGMSAEAARVAGYTVVEDRAALNAIQAGTRKVCGLFGEGHMPYEYDHQTGEQKPYKILPHLTEMTAKALELLSAGEKGFFLMVEGGRIDHACHNNEIERAIHETIEFDRAVRTVLDWAKDRQDTLVIVTADHECGGLAVLSNPGKGRVPEVRWGSEGHTSLRVPVFAWGAHSKLFAGRIDNTDIFRRSLKALGQAEAPAPAAAEADAKQPAPKASEPAYQP